MNRKLMTSLLILPLLILAIAVVSVSASSYYTVSSSCNNCQMKNIDFNKGYDGYQKMPQTTYQNKGYQYTTYNSNEVRTTSLCSSCGTYKTMYVMRSPDVHYKQVDVPNPCMSYWPTPVTSYSNSY